MAIQAPLKNMHKLEKNAFTRSLEDAFELFLEAEHSSRPGTLNKQRTETDILDHRRALRYFADNAGFSGLIFDVEADSNGLSNLRLFKSIASEQDQAEIMKMVELTQSAFRRSEGIANALETERTEEEAITVANDFFKNVYHLVVMNCLHVYVARAGEDTDEARAEGRRLNQLERDLNGQWDLSFVDEAAKSLGEVLLKSNGPKSAADFGRKLESVLLRYLVTGAILTVEAEVPQEPSTESWDESVWRTLAAYDTKAIIDSAYKADIYREAEDLLENELKPAEMSFEELRLWAGISLVEGSVATSALREVRPVKPNGLLNLPVDHAAFSLMQYLAGRVDARDGVGNFMKVPVKAPRGQLRELAVAETLPPELARTIDPNTVEPVLARIREDRNETKAKLFVGVLALASRQDVNPEKFFVSLGDLMLLITGYKRSGKNKTNNKYYWAKAAEVVRYLILDLAFTTVRVEVKLPHYKEVLSVEEWLMHRPRPAAKQIFGYSQFTTDIISLVNQKTTTELADYVKSVGLEGFFLGFPGEVLNALGARTGKGRPNALEKVPHEVLCFKGSAFWLAYEIAFLRRWANPKHAAPGLGKGLLASLETHGYRDESAAATGGNVSYKLALRAWFADIETLIDLNMLEKPGASIFSLEKGDWSDVTGKIKNWLTNKGVRITRDDIALLRVSYHLPRERSEQLAKLRAERENRRRA